MTRGLSLLPRLTALLRQPQSKPALGGPLGQLIDAVDDLRFQLGCLQVRQMRATPPSSLREAEFRVFSQFGEDGMIQYLLSKLGPVPQTFVEFGVGDYREANTLFLLMHDNWRGLVMDRCAASIEAIYQRPIAWRHDLRAVAAVINRDNINEVIASQGFSGDIGLLSIDVDGNDYWIWEAITVVRPVIAVVEYNSLFGCSRAVSIPYDGRFDRRRAHPSHLYWGCSLPALCHLARMKGYSFVGSNSAGNNAFFVRDDVRRDLPSLSPQEGYVESRFRESRNAQGRLTFLSGSQRLAAIADCNLVDVVTGETLAAEDLIRYRQETKGET